MASSPGHRKWPDHRVNEQRVEQRVRVMVGGDIVAESDDAVLVAEDGHPDRYYFPRGDVKTERLQRSATVTECPFKGTARYFDLQAGDERLGDAVWSYEDPYDEHRGLKDRIAFYHERIPQIELRVG